MTNLQLKVYYLDDEELLLEAFSDRFATSQILIETFSNFNDLERAISLEIPDVVVVDYSMPKKNGKEVAKALPEMIAKALVTGGLNENLDKLFERVFAKPYPESEIQEYFAEKLLAKRLRIRSG